jgi:hypothetical protein
MVGISGKILPYQPMTLIYVRSAVAGATAW